MIAPPKPIILRPDDLGLARGMREGRPVPIGSFVPCTWEQFGTQQIKSGPRMSVTCRDFATRDVLAQIVESRCGHSPDDALVIQFVGSMRAIEQFRAMRLYCPDLVCMYSEWATKPFALKLPVVPASTKFCHVNPLLRSMRVDLRSANRGELTADLASI